MSQIKRIDGSKIRAHELNVSVPFTDRKDLLGSIARGLKNVSYVMAGMYSSRGGCSAPPENGEDGNPDRDSRPF